MSFKMTAAHFYGTESSKAVSPYVSQVCEMVISGADADVDLDLDDYTGNFWTAALADGTYGTIALHVLNALKNVTPNVASTHWVSGNFMLYRARVPAGSEDDSTGAYSMNYNNTTKLPYFTFDTGNGPGGTNIIVTWGMKPGYQILNTDILV